jgi:hypothetical protein
MFYSNSDTTFVLTLLLQPEEVRNSAHLYFLQFVEFSGGLCALPFNPSERLRYSLVGKLVGPTAALARRKDTSIPLTGIEPYDYSP